MAKSDPKREATAHGIPAANQAGLSRRVFMETTGCGIAAILLSGTRDDSAEQSAAASEPRGIEVPAPWWDAWPGFVQVGDAALAQRLEATASLCGAADDACWGIWGQRLRVAESGPRETKAMAAAGIKALTWIEGFGTPSCYVVQLKRGPEGAWMKIPGTDVTRVFHSHWSWAGFDGTGEVRWVGVHTYWGDADYARPYTCKHHRYGAPPATYPDGRIASDHNGPAEDPRNSGIYDATCSKSILGNLWGADAGKPLITHLLRGGTRPVVQESAPDNTPAVVPDPGYTPAQWAEHTRKTGALTVFETGKDSACPMWIDYARAETRMALDAGVDGMWVDNFSPWDSFNASPVHHAFGEWAVARFRTHLEKRFSPAALEGMGISDVKTFDIRDYMKGKVRRWGGDAASLKDARWADARWQDDPIWRAYLIHRRVCGSEALSRLYRAIKEEAAKAGKPDFLVMGNDIPAFSLGWPRGDLDMVSTELTWGWWLGTGPRGIMAPPLGCYVPVYKLAREHARSRFVNTWPYAAEEVKGKPNIAKVILYQGLATHTLPMPQPDDKTLGTLETTAGFHRFVRSAAPTFGNRTPIEQVGLYYSSSSQLMEMLPAWYRDHNNQTHMFSFWGWGTALTWLHVPWRAVPEWKMAILKTLRLLIIPNAGVFPAKDVPMLTEWVQAGGRLIVSGHCGSRSGEDDNFETCETGSTLADLSGSAAQESRKLGKGRVLVRRADPGLPFYKADEQRLEILRRFSEALRDIGIADEDSVLTAPAASWKVGLTPYRDDGKLFIDVNNTDIDIRKDEVTPADPLRLIMTLPIELRSKSLTLKVLSPGPETPGAELKAIDADRVMVSLGPVQIYASVMIR